MLGTQSKTPQFSGENEGLQPVATSAIPPRGVEAKRLTELSLSNCDTAALPGGAESGAVVARDAELAVRRLEATDPDLAHVIAAWPALPVNIRAAIRALVEASAAKN